MCSNIEQLVWNNTLLCKEILKHLSIEEVKEVRRVNRVIWEVANGKQLWKQLIWPDTEEDIDMTEKMLMRLKYHAFNKRHFSFFFKRSLAVRVYHGVLLTPVGKKKSVYKFYEFSIFQQKDPIYKALKYSDKGAYEDTLKQHYDNDVDFYLRKKIKLQIKFDNLLEGKLRL